MLYIYQFIRTNGGFDNWDILQIEQYNCNTKQELLLRERYWTIQEKATLNKQVQGRTDKEYKQDNKDKISQQNKKYKENNKEKLLIDEYQFNYRINKMLELKKHKLQELEKEFE